MTGTGDLTWPAQVRGSLDRMQQTDHDQLVFDLVVTGTATTEELENVMRAHLQRAAHEVQRFWFGECNCHGRLN